MRDVKRDELRWMLKRIAMGLAVTPLALIAACGGQGGGDAGPDSSLPNGNCGNDMREATVSSADLLSAGSSCSSLCPPSPRMVGGIGNPYSVTVVCTPQQGDSGMLDAGGDDAWPSQSTISCHYAYQCLAGRRPAAGVRSVRGRGVATWLAETAQLEAASVDAFAELRAELIAHQAPSRILAATSRAEADEVVHARLVGSFARRAGATPVRPSVARSAPRALFDIAKHNASEGCVREAFGAINALHQAESAATPELREGFLRIARDEARHALLSLELEDWMRTKLNAQQHRALDEEREVAADELARNVGLEDRETRSVLGLPDQERGRDLVRMCA